MGLFSSKSKSKTTVTPYDPRQLRGILSRLETLGETPMEFFPDQTYANLDPLQQEALRRQEAVARATEGRLLDPTTQAWQQMLAAPDVASNPYVNAMLESQRGLLTRNLQENILPGLRQGAIGAGQLGSARQGVMEGQAIGRTQQAIADAAARTQLGAYGQGLTQRQAGVAGLPGIMASQLFPAETLGQTGAAMRAEEQRAIDEAMQRHQFAQMEPWERTQMQAGLFDPLTARYATTTSKSKSKASPFSSIVGAGMMGLGLASGGMFGGLGGALGGLGGMFGGNPAGGIMGGAPTPGPYGSALAARGPVTAPQGMFNLNFGSGVY